MKNKMLVLIIVATCAGCAANPTDSNQRAEVLARYPWDQRPAECFVAPPPNKPECGVDLWPSFDATWRQVAYLYVNGKFDLLERAMRELASSDKTYMDGETASNGVYHAFKRLMPSDGTGTPPPYAEQLARWRAAMPSSAFVPFAEARQAYSEAWSARGTGYASSVSPESWQLFRERLAEAERLLMAAPAELRETPYWYRLMLAVTLDETRPQNPPQKVFEEAVRKWPRNVAFYEVILTRLVPKWGGSWEEVEAFIRHWSDQTAALDGSALYARLYIGLLDDGVTPEQTMMDWGRMKQGFQDLIRQYPHWKYKNLYASYACFARDKQTFNAAMLRMGKAEIDPKFWLSGQSYDGCMRWAAI
jgi:hypothetical protein